MKKLSIIAAIFTFVAALIGLIVAMVYFLDRKCGIFGEEEDDEMEYCGEEYYAEDLSLEPEEEAPVAEEVAEE